ncbi:Elongation factor 1-alpha [Babesia microti strain RI]|uniref:Elongation factor 1-alpha n=1 Tax=Babesia microti (strain RI) TaxID=1133968 RepID=I7J8L9_BABMR|nr:Elongation factor 1-alpha [Babesia microti strain RI]CCF75473.1 Elongation factor 1-alpha [Babesia microti strain RI]|eukprot:XP_012649881.1 Elongation factor 1-alpha [Babesia microti strain RI]
MRGKHSLRDFITQELNEASDCSDISDISSGVDFFASLPKPNYTKQHSRRHQASAQRQNSEHGKTVQFTKGVPIDDFQGVNQHPLPKTDPANHSTLPNGTLNVLIGGPVDSGKSTLIAHILTRDHKSKPKHLADLLDNSTEERERGITIHVKLNRCSYNLCGLFYNVLLLDTPGHCDLFTSLIKSSLIAQQSVLILDITKLTKFNQSSSFTVQNMVTLGINHMLIYHHCIGNDIIICINKMDLVDYSEPEFIAAKSLVVGICKSLLKININFTFIPIVSNTGLNIDKPSVGNSVDGLCSWYKGNTLFQELSHRIDIMKPIPYGSDLVCHVIDQWANNKELKLTIYVESGSLSRYNKATALPSLLDVTVIKDLSSKSFNNASIGTGSVLDVTIRSQNVDSLGDIVAIVHGIDIPRVAEWISVKLYASKISKSQLTIGQSVELIIGNVSEEAFIEVVKDSNNENSYVIRPGMDYVVSFRFASEAIVHPDSTGAKRLSKVIVRSSGTVVGWGTIVSCR